MNASVEGYLLNDQHIVVDRKGNPIFGAYKPKRCSPRTLSSPSAVTERQALDTIKEEMFIEDESISNKWIMKTLGIKLVKFEEARSIALFFAHCIKEIMVREYYRRKKTIFYWLDKRFHLIMEFCKNNDCRIFYNQKLYKFSVDETDVSVQQETTIHDECINFDQLIQEDDEYFIDTGMV